MTGVQTCALPICARSEGTETLGGKSKAKSIAPSIPEHKIKFEEFHNQVRSFVGGAGGGADWRSRGTARSSHLHWLYRTGRERSHDGAFLPPRRASQLTPRWLDESRSPRLLHVACLCSATRLHSQGRRARFLRFLRHHEPRHLAHQGPLRPSFAPVAR